MEEEVEEASRLQRTKREIEFDYQDYIKKFADGKVIRTYATLLRSYQTNGQHVNHCIVKMLHRIAYQLKMYGFLFQASIFRVFQQIHSTSQFDPSYREIVALGDWVLRKFFEVFKRNPVAVAELLFWKHSKEMCFEITEGYGTIISKSKSKKAVWSDEDNDELEKLFNQHRAKLQDGTLVDTILSELTNESRTRQQVSKQLVNLGLVDNPGLLKSNKGTGVWRGDDVDELRRLFEEYKDASDPLGCIVPMLSRKFTRAKCGRKLIELGLVNDKKSLYKKRSRKPRSEEMQERVVEEQPGPSYRTNAEESSNQTPMDDESSDDDDDNDADDIIDDIITDMPIEKLLEMIRDEGDETVLESLSWLSRSLQQTETTSSSGESVPLVPFTENQESAIVNPLFKSLLIKIGIKPPSSDQIFWRISTSTGGVDLKSVVEILKEKHLTTPTTSHNISVLPPPAEDDDDEFEVVRTTKRRRMTLDDDEDDDED